MSYDKLDPTTFNQSAKHARQEWHCVVDNDTLITDILKPVYWVHVYGFLRPGALVDIVSKDYTLDITLRVTAVQNGIVSVRPIRVYEDTKAREEVYKQRKYLAEHPEEAAQPGMLQQAEIAHMAPPGYKVGFSPNNSTWYVQLKATGLKLYKDIPEKQKALDLAVAHAKASGVEFEVV